jgi:hypothetical protein
VGQKDEALFSLLDGVLRSSLSESDSIKIFMASPEVTIHIVGANVLAFVDRMQSKVDPTSKLYFCCFIRIAILTSPV